jgi:hypothetical protein
MEYSGTMQRELSLRLAHAVLDATSDGFEVTRDYRTHWAISQKQKDEIRMCALFLSEMLVYEQ